MTTQSSRGHEVTALLQAHRGGDATAFDRIVELLYPELRVLAKRWRSGPGATLDTTAMVHEAYVKMAGGAWAWQDRAHFLAAAAQAMRHIAVDYARNRQRKKRGGGESPLPLQDRDAATAHNLETILAVDAALRAVQTASPRMVRVVECRYFAGMTVPETAAALDTSVSTVEREWREAKRQLQQRLSSTGAG